MTRVKFRVFKTIRLGTGLRTPDDFCEALRVNNFSLTSTAKSILYQPAFTISLTPKVVNLVRLGIFEFGHVEDGLNVGIDYSDICQSALESGLELCPAEAGPQLRLQYPDQPKKEHLILAMESIVHYGGHSKGQPGVFHVEHGYWPSETEPGHRLSLDGYSSGPGYRCSKSFCLVFVLPRKKS